MSEEVWKDVVGYEGIYQVSDRGRVKTLPLVVNAHHNTTRVLSERIRKVRVNKGGYADITLSRNGIKRKFLVHVLVAQAFLGDPPGKLGNTYGEYTVDHLDGVKLNNVPSNLEYVTREENHRRWLKRAGFDVSKKDLTNADVEAMRAMMRTGRFTVTDISKVFRIATAQGREILGPKVASTVTTL